MQSRAKDELEHTFKANVEVCVKYTKEKVLLK